MQTIPTLTFSLSLLRKQQHISKWVLHVAFSQLYSSNYCLFHIKNLDFIIYLYWNLKDACSVILTHSEGRQISFPHDLNWKDQLIKKLFTFTFLGHLCQSPRVSNILYKYNVDLHIKCMYICIMHNDTQSWWDGLVSIRCQEIQRKV